MDYATEIRKILEDYESNNYQPKPIAPKYKAIAGEENKYQLQIPLKEEPASEIVKNYIDKHIEIWGFSKDEKKFESFDNKDINVAKMLLDAPREDIKNIKTLEEAYQLTVLIPYLTALTKVPPQIKRLLKSQFQMLREAFDTIVAANGENTTSNSDKAQSESNNLVNKKEEVNNQQKENVVEEVVKQDNAPVIHDVNNDVDNIVNRIRHISRKEKKLNREDTHTAKNFKIENGLFDVLKKIKQELGHSEFEVLNIALRSYIEIGYPEYVHMLDDIEKMKYKLLE